MEMKKSKILLVDDEPELLRLIKTLLEQEGFAYVETAANCHQAESLIREGQKHLVILDVMLPDGTGFDLYRKLQAEGILKDVPVVFLSARDEDAAKLKGLGLGADDYITKPFLPVELLLRIKAVLRRTYRFHDMGDDLHLGDVVISFEAGTVDKGGDTLTLTAKEYAILKKLAENRGKIVTIDTLCDTLWPDGSYGLESSLIVHIRHLREKVEEDPSNPKYLVTVRGLGYKLEK
ncbi:MAG: response regulator transcription factor [Blautia sp.]|nr:response regulator transcription factor [Blautia sp.]